jgi:hypothetical protein
VVERSPAWLAEVRRLGVRYVRRDDIHQAVLDFGRATICFRMLS